MQRYISSRQIVLVLFAFLCIVSLTAGVSATAPVAVFSGTPTSGGFPLTVQFTSTSTNDPTGLAWYFGDEDWTSPTWIRQTSSAGWTARSGQSSVTMPNGSILLMGGYDTSGNYKNDTWQSTDKGMTWALVNGSSGWSPRSGLTSVVLSDGSILLMGGQTGSSSYMNDTWQSIDKGVTWTNITDTNYGDWSPRSGLTSVLLPNGHIVLMGGQTGTSSYTNDVWQSANNGATWTVMDHPADWSARSGQSSVTMPNGSIVMMGGNNDGYTYYNDVWQSTNGNTWTLTTASAGWTPRFGQSTVIMPDGSIVLTGGKDAIGTYKNDVWRSADNGTTWATMDTMADWSARSGQTSVVLPDGSIVLMGGYDGSSYKNDVWRLDTARSAAPLPPVSHSYSAAGIYPVTLQAYNLDGYNSTPIPIYITATGPLPVVSFTNNKTTGTTATGVAPFTVLFAGSATNSPTSWSWNATNVTPGNLAVDLFNTTQNPVKIFTNGNWSINLTATNFWGSNISAQVFYVNVSPCLVPVASFNVNKTPLPILLPAPFTVQFTDTSTNSPTIWAWNVTNDTAAETVPTTFNTTQNPVQVFGNGASGASRYYFGVGNFSITLNATNSAGFNISYPVTWINVSAANPTVTNFTVNTNNGPAPLTVQFTDASTGIAPLTYQWIFSDHPEVIETTQNPSHPFHDPGIYSVSHSATNTTGPAVWKNVTANITVNVPAPVANFIGSPTSVTTGSSVTFTDQSTNNPTGRAWFFGDENWTTLPWALKSSVPGWSARFGHTSVAMPNGSIVLMGGLTGTSTYMRDVWLSADNGTTWTSMASSAEWSARYGHSSVTTPNGSIVLMGGYDTTSIYKNDTWQSTNNGTTWANNSITSTASLGWSPRSGHTSVAMPNGSIVLMGGYDTTGIYKNDTWMSTNNGAIWTNITSTASLGWSPRSGHTSVVMPNGSIVLMGGNSAGTYKNDVWLSTNNGTTWAQKSSAPGWSARFGHTSVAMPDGSIVLMGGYDISGWKNDVWRSTDNGTTWTQITTVVGWTARYGHTSVAMRDGSIILAGGNAGGTVQSDVWRLTPATESSTSIKTHIYTTAGTYPVALQAYNIGGYGSMQRSGYITVTAPSGVPVASFTGSPIKGTAPLTVLFNDTSTGTGITSWNWTFGSSSAVINTTQNCTHTFTVPGLYNVYHSASNNIGTNWSNQTSYINVTRGVSETGVYRPGAAFYLKTDNGSTWNLTDLTLIWDNYPTDLPIAGDWNGDGIIKTGVYRPGAGFYLKMNNSISWNSNDQFLAWDNATGDLPIAGDWNWDGRDETGVYRPGVGFYLKMDNGSTWNPSTDLTLTWDNWPTDLPVAGDWNWDGRDETGVYRPGVGFLLKMDHGSTWNSVTDRSLTWDNLAGDLPIAGDWNGNGAIKTGVYRPGTGFYLKMNDSTPWNPLTDQYLAWDNAIGDLPIAGNFA